MSYYFAGCFLIKLKPYVGSLGEHSVICSCSSCLNTHLLDEWSYSWLNNLNDPNSNILSPVDLIGNQIHSIQVWVDTQFDNQMIGWINVFFSSEIAMNYKAKFYGTEKDVVLLSLYIEDEFRDYILDEFKPRNDSIAEVGIYKCLLNKIPEDDKANEILLGYDYIGIEESGSFHSFHCHHLGNDLTKKFRIDLNNYGLFDSSLHKSDVEEYLNDSLTGIEAVPWGIAKVKMVQKW